MRKYDLQLIITPSDYENFDEMVDDLYWNDKHLLQEDTYYIHDVNQDIWYSIEYRNHYGNIIQLFEFNKTMQFDEVKDEDLIEELEEIFYGD